MKTIAQKKFWKFLFWLGPFLVTAGLTVGLISGWGVVPLLLLISGLCIIATWIVLVSKKNNWLEKRSTQAGTNALFATLAVLTILGLINFLGARYHLRTDLTEAKLFSLAPQTQELVRTLTQPVKVWIFDTNQNTLDRDLLENYRRQSRKFEFEYVDPQAKPGLAKQFGVKEAGEVYLESNNQRKLVQVLNQSERLSEIRLTNRLQQINSGEATKAYFLQGHGEHQLTGGESTISQAVQALNDKSFTTEALNLAEKAKVPADANVVIVAGPKRALFDTEVKALQDYLNRGGNALLMIDPDTDPKLDPLLNEWGVKLDNRLVVDMNGSDALGPAVPIVTDYGKHPITKDFGNGISFYRLARPVDITPVNNVQATPLLLTKPYPSTWAESDQKSEKLEFNQDQDRKGPLTLGVALSKKISAPSTSNIPTPTPTSTTSSNSQEARLVVIGNSDFATNGLFQLQLNGDVFLNSVTWLSQQDQQPLSIRPKEAKNRRINLSTAQTILLRWSTLFILPFVGFIGAGLLWWQRR
ncbi:MAG: Gldg family protein [Calothrix sp. C42_A2020_038]|nr:Gldg family protein [Calothrix sp. C42_A2020_038]